MKTYQTIEEKKEIVVQKHKKLVELQCDLCKAIAPTSDWFTDSDDEHGTSEVKVEWTRNVLRYGEPDYEKYSFDICPECFINTLAPFLKERGAKIYSQSRW